jgi:hypothetical protein
LRIGKQFIIKRPRKYLLQKRRNQEMNGLNILGDNNQFKASLRERIDLNNRPKLGVSRLQIDQVAEDLAGSRQQRDQFLSNPSAYLMQREIPASECQLSAGAVQQTSEACTAVAICNVAVVVTVVAAVYAVAGVVAVAAAAVITTVSVVPLLCRNSVSNAWETGVV